MREQSSWFDHAIAVIDRATAEAIAASRLLHELCAMRETAGTGSLTCCLELPSTALHLVGLEGLDSTDSLVGGARRVGGAGVVLASRRATAATAAGALLSVRAAADVDADQRAVRYAAWLADPRPGALPLRLLDLATVEIAAAPPEIRAAAPLFEAVGFSVESAGGTVTARDGSVTLELRPGASPGLRRVVLGLSEAPGDERAEHLGRSLLVLGPAATAVWEFGAS